VPVRIGDPFGPLETPGQKNSISIPDWINYDTDTVSPDYATYAPTQSIRETESAS